MPYVDNDMAVRKRAYEIWEREGRPSGREHEHWAEAAREIEGAAADQASSGSGGAGLAERKPDGKDTGNGVVTGDVRSS